MNIYLTQSLKSLLTYWGKNAKPTTLASNVDVIGREILKCKKPDYVMVYRRMKVYEKSKDLANRLIRAMVFLVSLINLFPFLLTYYLHMLRLILLYIFSQTKLSAKPKILPLPYQTLGLPNSTPNCHIATHACTKYHIAHYIYYKLFANAKNSLPILLTL